VNNRKKTIIFIALSLLALLLVKREQKEGSFLESERQYVNWLIDTKKQKKETSSITLLALDNSEDSVLQDWPPSPLDFAVMLNNLKKYNPGLIAIEPSLEFPNSPDGLIETLRTTCLNFKKDSLLFSAICQMDHSVNSTKDKGKKFFDVLKNVNGNTESIPEFTKTTSMPNQRFAAMGIPISFTAIDLTQKKSEINQYKFPLIAKVGNEIIPSFVLKALMLETNTSPDQVLVNLGEKITLNENKIIPIDAGGHVEIYPALQKELPKEKINLLTTPSNELSEKSKSSLNNRIILIGNNNVKNITFRNDDFISNAEFMALAISTIQSGLFISELSPTKEFIIWMIIIILGALIINTKSSKALPRIGLLIIIYLSFNMILFQSNGQWVSPIIPVAFFIIIALISLVFSEKKEA
tara:strand:+ start:4826 stop:6055 length:1230 start_codon:yes stop_codon:yes gene_type:complete